MDFYFYIAIAIVFLIGCICLIWKILQYVTYKISNQIAKGIYDAKNGIEAHGNTNSSSGDLRVDDHLSISEKRIRKYWLTSFYSYYASTPLILSVCLLLGLLFNPQQDLDLSEAWISIAAYALVSLIAGCLMYYFAYVVNGTKWIGWFIIVSPLSTIAGIGRDPPKESVEWAIQIIFIAFYIYFWVNSRRLYNLNHALKKNDLIGNDVQSYS